MTINVVDVYGSTGCRLDKNSLYAFFLISSLKFLKLCLSLSSEIG